MANFALELVSTPAVCCQWLVQWELNETWDFWIAEAFLGFAKASFFVDLLPDEPHWQQLEQRPWLCPLAEGSN